MERNSGYKHPLLRQDGEERKTVLPGYPNYPEDEDIYKQCKEEKEIDPEDVTIVKKCEVVGEFNAKDFIEDMSGSDLDVPGSELDDNEEEIGSEDEENNFYSLGGENHPDM